LDLRRARGSRFGDRLALRQYLAASHIVCIYISGVQTIPDKQLAAVRANAIRAFECLTSAWLCNASPGTELVLTVTSGSTQSLEEIASLRVVKAPHDCIRFISDGLASETSNASRHVWLAKRCDQQLTLSINNPNGVEDSIQIEKASSRWPLGT